MSGEVADAVIVDNGSYMIKAGFAGDDAPRVIFRSIVCRSHQKDTGILELKYPIEHGIITSWDDIEKLWHDTFYNKLRIAPEEHPVLFTESSLNPKRNRENTTQIMFEVFTVPAYYVCNAGVLSLYASGRTTGIIVDCGYQQIQSMAIYEGYCIPHTVIKSQYGGKHCTEYLQKLILENNGKNFNTKNIDDIRMIKEQFGYIAKDYDKEIDCITNKTFCFPDTMKKMIICGYLRSMDINHTIMDIENICCKYWNHDSDFFAKYCCKSFDLPDGNKLITNLGNEQIKCTEVLFKPSLMGLEQDGIHKIVVKTCNKAGSDFSRMGRAWIWQNIVLSGGTSMFPYFGERLKKEVENERWDLGGEANVKVISPSERKYSAWLGASCLCVRQSFDSMWITKDEYDESGPSIVHRKCF